MDFHDHARDILSATPIDDESKVALWDHYHGAQTSAELAARLQGVPVDDFLKQLLIAAKKLSDPELTPTEKVTDVIGRISKMDKRTLQIAESHPNILRALTDAATKE